MKKFNLLIAMLLALGLTAACGDGDDDDVTPGQDSSSMDASDDDASAADCFTDPEDEHLQIINACTDAEKVTVEEDLPLLNDDGTLPELP